MKWNNRLKSVLTKPAESVFSEDCLETELRITAETPLKLVSAVIRSDELRHFSENQTNSDTGEKESNLVSAVIRSAYSRESLKTSDDLARFEADAFHEVLNRFIDDGITFEVSADDFQTVDPAQRLKTSDKEFLKLNGAAILCQLQQSLLMKHLFSHSPGQFEDFACAIAEREAIMTGDGRESFSIHCEAVKDVSKNWFSELLKDIAE
jgi:hypothetical protein